MNDGGHKQNEKEARKLEAFKKASELLAPLPAEDAERILASLWELYARRPRGR